MNIRIIGAGSMGMLFAAKCAPFVDGMILVANTAEQATHIEQQGINLLDMEGKEQTVQVAVTSYEQDAWKVREDERQLSSSRFPSPTAQWLFLFVKQHHIDERLAHYINDWVMKGASVLCFQNGVGHVEKLARIVPRQHIYVAVTTEAALKQGATAVIHTGTGQTWIGQMGAVAEDALTDDHAQNKLVNMLSRAGFAVSLSKNKKLEGIVWTKLLINAVINPLTAILQVKNGQLLTSAHWQQVMRSLYEEGRAVADAYGVELSRELWEQIVAVCEKTAANHSSMLQDIQQRRVTEIDWINGAVITLAKKKQVQVPTHLAVYNIIKGMEHEMERDSRG